MTTTEITNLGNFANALSAAFTAYIAMRTLYLWYKYLSQGVNPEPKGTIHAFFQNRAVANPPPWFSTWDLIVATILLVFSSAAGVLLYVWSVIATILQIRRDALVPFSLRVAAGSKRRA